MDIDLDYIRLDFDQGLYYSMEYVTRGISFLVPQIAIGSPFVVHVE